ncbi:MAG TPA: iron permease [Planctomycetaceae bacterium]|nr:iron permease [Planctomycetaceae bacterium]
MPILAAAAADTSVAVGLTVYLVLIAAAALLGGSSVVLVSLGHRPMQVLLSLTGGVLLGVGMLHLLPHACLALGNDVESAAGWAVVGFFAMFLLERAFHGHSHQVVEGAAHDGDEHHGAGCGHESRPHAHGEACGHAAAPGGTGRWAWCGAFVGLALHSLSDGAALAASVRADAAHGGGTLSGLATFLAIVLHKPIDSALIATLMIAAGVSTPVRRLVNVAYALVVPAGALGFVGLLRMLGVDEGAVIGIAMAIAAGAFICIAAADLLPEVQFHSHDRVLLTSALAIGLALAWGITVVERSSHAHEVHAGAAGHRAHNHGDHGP